MKKSLLRAISIAMCLVTICTSIFIAPITSSAAAFHLTGYSGYLTGDDSYHYRKIELNRSGSYRMEFKSDCSMNVTLYARDRDGIIVSGRIKDTCIDFSAYDSVWMEVEMDLSKENKSKYNFSYSFYDIAKYATEIWYYQDEYVFSVDQKPWVYYSTNGNQPRSVSLKSSDPKLVKVIGNSLERGEKKEGSCIITATLDNGASASTKVTFTYATGINLLKTNIYLGIYNKGEQITYETSPTGITQVTGNGAEGKVFQYPPKSLKWESSNTKVATVDSNGIVRATGLGKCTVYAILNGTIKKGCNVFVSSFETTAFTNSALDLPTISGQKAGEWKSGDTSVAKIKNGKVEFKKAGKTLVKTKYNGKEYLYNYFVISESAFKKKAVAKFLRNGKRKKSQIKAIWRGLDENNTPTIHIKYTVKSKGKTKYKYYRYIYCDDCSDYMYKGCGDWSKRGKLHYCRQLKV